MWIILVFIAAFGSGVAGYRAATGYHGPALYQQIPTAVGQASHAAPVNLPHGS